jgi:ribonucleotide monophosphatase NagD (HAD superfamily)
MATGLLRPDKGEIHVFGVDALADPVAAKRMVAWLPDEPMLYDKLIWCGGALARLYQEMGGTVVMAGKPHAAVYRCAMEAMARAAGRPLDPSRVLAIGDGVGTDVKGANGQGLDCLFVAAGISSAETLGLDGLLDPARLEALLLREGAYARYALPDLRW